MWRWTDRAADAIGTGWRRAALITKSIALRVLLAVRKSSLRHWLAVAVIAAAGFYFSAHRVVNPPLITAAFIAFPLRASASTADKTLVVFVHGIGGHYTGTWQRVGEDQKPISFLNFCTDDKALKSYDFISIGYPTHQTLDRAGFKAQVDSLRDFIETRCSQYQRTVFVAHSMGGMITAYALSLSNILSQEAQHVTLITLSTPFRGSKLADLAKTYTAASSRQLAALRTDDGADLKSLVNEYWTAFRSRHHGRILHFAGIERHKTNGLLVVTTESGSGPEGGDADEIMTFDDMDHFQMACPENTSSALYQAVKRWITFQSDSVASSNAVMPLDGLDVKPGKIYGFKADEVTIDRDILIPAGARLVFRPGQKIRWTGTAVLQCEGTLFAGEPDLETVSFDFSQSERPDEAAILLRGPFTRGSRFSNCEFINGRGVRIRKPNPKTFQGLDWNEFGRAVERAPTDNSLGGAVLLLSTGQISFQNCQFRNNSAYQGGAVFLLNSQRTEFSRCIFNGNRSGFGGGAVFLQASEAYFRRCRFENNQAGIDWRRTFVDRPTPQLGSEFACGGAVYIGHDSHVELRTCELVNNRARYVGGALYFLDANISATRSATPSILASSRVVGNRVLSEFGGGGVYIDQRTRLAITRTEFVANTSGSGIASGRDCVDASRLPSSLGDISGLEIEDEVSHFVVTTSAGTSAVPGAGAQTEASQAVSKSFDADTSSPSSVLVRPNLRRVSNMPDVKGMLPVHKKLIINPKCFKTVEQPRTVNAVVVHHVSALNWDDPAFRGEFCGELESFEKTMPALDASERKYDWRHCVKIFELYGVSSHYLIDRSGLIYQLVLEENIAHHAGKSRMPQPDGRENVNEFSIGIELIATHPDDDPQVTSDTAYTPFQYDSLHWLLRDICLRHHIDLSAIVGHDQISPGRKKDPGSHFDWKGVQRRLDDDLQAIRRSNMFPIHGLPE